MKSAMVRAAVVSQWMAKALLFRLDKRFVLSINGNSVLCWWECICCTLNYATRTIVCRNCLLSLVVIRYCMYLYSVLMTWHSVLLGLSVGVHYICTPQRGLQLILSELLVWLPEVIPRVIFLCVSTTDTQLDGASLCDACFDNRQDFLSQGTI